MSRASNQSLLLLSMVNGCLLIMEAEKMLTDDTRATHMWASDQVQALIRHWPATGDMQKNAKWMHDQLVAWSALIHEQDKAWSACSLVNLSLHILEDLASVIKNSAKLFGLRDLRESVIALSAEVGKQAGAKEEFLSLEEADDVLKKMYRLIGFSL